VKVNVLAVRTMAFAVSVPERGTRAIASAEKVFVPLPRKMTASAVPDPDWDRLMAAFAVREPDCPRLIHASAVALAERGTRSVASAVSDPARGTRTTASDVSVFAPLERTMIASTDPEAA
jgi:hypothetical protein